MASPAEAKPFMRTLFLLASLLGALPAASSLAQSQGMADYFFASSDHFQHFAGRSAKLQGATSEVAEKVAANLLTATALLFAERAHLMATLLSLEETVVCPEDRALIRERVRVIAPALSKRIVTETTMLRQFSGNLGSKALEDVNERMLAELRTLGSNLARLVEADKGRGRDAKDREKDLLQEEETTAPVFSLPPRQPKAP